MSFIGDAISAVSSAFSFLSGPTGSILGNIGGSLGPILNTVENTVSGIVNPIENLVNGVSTTLNDVVTPIKGTIDSITNLARSINDGLVQPVTTLINSTQSTYKALTSEIEGLIKGGISGLSTESQAIANTLTRFDTSFGQAQQELGLKQEKIAAGVLVPGMQEAFGKPLGDLINALGSAENFITANAEYKDRISLAEPNCPTDIIAKINSFGDRTKSSPGVFGELIKWIYDALFVIPYAAILLKNDLLCVEQDANTKTPRELLSAGDVIEALRRGFLGAEDAKTELLKLGVDPTRQKVLYDLAQFLFGPREAVDLLARGIIDQATFAGIMDQNNFDPGQSQSLIELMRFLFSPADATTLWYRGLIDDAALEQVYRAAKIIPAQDALVKALELEVINPRARVEAQGRLDEAAADFLAGTFGVPVPAEVEAIYRAAQLPPEQAKLDWLLHWRVPRADWWIDAVFRGVRTKTEAYAAFQLENIPQEIWEDLFTVARELPPVWLVPDVIASGVYSEDQALKDFAQLGFSPEDAKVLYDYGKTKSKTTKAATAADIAGLTLSTIGTLYDDGAIDRTDYVSFLQAHGLGSEAAELTAEARDLSNETKTRKAYATDLVDEVKLGTLTLDDAVSQLYSTGYTSAEVAAYQLQMVKALKANSKRPTRAELEEFLKYGLITGAAYVAAVSALGYSDTVASFFLEVWIAKNGQPPAG